MRIFISAGEPSGDMHGSNLAMALKARRPSVQITGFGGPRLSTAGQEQIYPLANHAVIGIWRSVVALPQFWRIFQLALKQFDEHRPDALVLIDYPGFHWHVAKAAKKRGIPVFWFVPPQIWAWATHRVKWMKRSVDHVFCNLPFETEWYQKKGMPSSFIGHPYFDELSKQQLDHEFIQQHRSQPGRIVALLPGSRTHEVHDNVPMMLQSARLVHQAIPDTRFLVAGFKESHTQWINQQLNAYPDLPVEVCLGRTPEIIQVSDVCLSVSGSVSLELLNATLPTITLYKISKLLHPLVSRFKHARYISLINLLAEKEVSPEYLTSTDESASMADRLIGWLRDESSRQSVIRQMQEIKNGVARPGACEHAVDHLLTALESTRKIAA